MIPDEVKIDPLCFSGPGSTAKRVGWGIRYSFPSRIEWIIMDMIFRKKSDALDWAKERVAPGIEAEVIPVEITYMWDGENLHRSAKEYKVL